MNCTDFEKLILLEDTSEISREQQQALEVHLASCTDCQKVKTDLALLKNRFALATTGHSGPSQLTLSRILNAAQPHQPRKTWFIQHRWPLALAAAACLALCLSTLQFTRVPHPIIPCANDQTSLASEIIPLIAMVTGIEPEQLIGTVNDSEITILADEFLRIQDITLDYPADISDSTTLPEDYQPTTLQWNSNRELLSGRCG
jgi:hypothetical protein